jgi:hypothetical protein
VDPWNIVLPLSGLIFASLSFPDLFRSLDSPVLLPSDTGLSIFSGQLQFKRTLQLFTNQAAIVVVLLFNLPPQLVNYYLFNAWTFHPLMFLRKESR